MSELDERFRSAAQACDDTVVWHSQRGPAETMNGAALDKDPATGRRVVRRPGEP